MQSLSAPWLYPIIIIAGALQAWGPPMNGALRNALSNPWLASVFSFLPVIAFLLVLFLCLPRPGLALTNGLRGPLASGRLLGRKSGQQAHQCLRRQPERP
jgi:hypothetical protein